MFKISPEKPLPRFKEDRWLLEDGIWKLETLKIPRKTLVMPEIFYTYYIRSSSTCYNPNTVLEKEKENYSAFPIAIDIAKQIGKETTSNIVERYLSFISRSYCFWKFDYKGDKKIKKEHLKANKNMAKRIISIIPKKEIKDTYLKNNLYPLFMLLNPFTKRAKLSKVMDVSDSLYQEID